MLFKLINQRNSRLNYSGGPADCRGQQKGQLSNEDNIDPDTSLPPSNICPCYFLAEYLDFVGPGVGYERVGKAWWIYMLCCLLLTLLTVGTWASRMVWRIDKAVQEERRDMGEPEHNDFEAQR